MVNINFSFGKSKKEDQVAKVIDRLTGIADNIINKGQAREKIWY